MLQCARLYRTNVSRKITYIHVSEFNKARIAHESSKTIGIK